MKNLRSSNFCAAVSKTTIAIHQKESCNNKNNIYFYNRSENMFTLYYFYYPGPNRLHSIPLKFVPWLYKIRVF